MHAPVQAAVVDFNVYYLSDTLSTTTDDTVNHTIYSAFIGFALDKKAYFNLGWNYGTYSTETQAGTTKKTYNSTQMGPGMLIYFDKDHQWVLGFSYNLSIEGTYKNGTATEQKWDGTAMAGFFGAQFLVGDFVFVGARLNYSSTSYTEKVVGSTLTEVSYTKSMIYPSIGLAFEF